MTISYGILLHGGVGSSLRLAGICRSIGGKAFVNLETGAKALDEVVQAVRLLEDDGRFNAGRGSVLRLDGETVEMDASVMASDGRIGAVMAIRGVRNPVIVAKAVTETPHIALAGEGATLFAGRLGAEPSLPPSDRVIRRYEKTRRMMAGGLWAKRDERWRLSEPEKFWNFSRPYGQVFPSDTVGAVAVDRSGALAVACSTGGASPMLNGRVGDTAIIGAGFYAGPLAAIAVTGIGEEIMRRMLAKTVYDLIMNGQDIVTACDNGIDLFPSRVSVGLIAISRNGFAIRANRRMAASSLIEEA